jgi:hypothetical protein
MTRNDKTIVCKDCGRSFIFRADEQDFFAQKGYSEPTRCKDCRAARKNSAGASNGRAPRAGSPAGRFSDRRIVPGNLRVLREANAGALQTEEDRPVYCSDCFSKQR